MGKGSSSQLHNITLCARFFHNISRFFLSERKKQGAFRRGMGPERPFFQKNRPGRARKGKKRRIFGKRMWNGTAVGPEFPRLFGAEGTDRAPGVPLCANIPIFFAAGVEFSAKRCYLNRRAKSNERTLLYGLTEKTLFCGYSSICKNGSVTENANFRNRSPEACGMHFHKCTPSALVIGYWRTSVTMWSGCAFFVPPISQQRKGGNKSQFYFVSLVCLKPS